MSSDWPTWPGPPSARHSARDGRSMPNVDQRRALARRWLSKARTDLAVASVILEKRADMDPWACCFHAQQAAEKALKAVLVAQGAEPPFIHNLVALQALVPRDLDLGTPVAELAD